MSKKKPPTTIEECNAEMELTQKKIRQYENRNKMLDRKLAIEKRKERNHRLCSRGGYLESLVPALIDMSEQEARDFLYTAVFSDKAQEFLRKRAGEATPKNYPCTQGRTYTPLRACALCRGLIFAQGFYPALRLAALPQQGAAPLAPLRGYPCTPTKTVHPPLASVPFLRVLLSYPGGDTHSHLPLEHRYCEPRKRQISRCRSRLPKRRKADKRVGRNDP